MTLNGADQTTYHRSSCPVPNGVGSPSNHGEGPSLFVTWASSGVAQFQATIQPPINVKTGSPYTYFNWSGRSPTESFSDPVSTCTPVSIQEPTPAPAFPIHNDNEIYDYVGLPSVTGTNQLRMRDVVPCSLTVKQTMSIDCSAGYQNGEYGTQWAYETHNLLFQVNASTITIQRNGAPTTPANQPFGTPKAGLRTASILPLITTL
jgi:hypothetical protein